MKEGESLLSLLDSLRSQRRDKMLPIRTKKEENKRAKKEGPRKLLVQPKVKENILGGARIC